MSEIEENLNLDVDPSERSGGGSLDAAPQDEAIELDVDPSERPEDESA
jgi:hypothetical protein